MPIQFYATTSTDEYIANMTDADWFDLMVDAFIDDIADDMA